MRKQEIKEVKYRMYKRACTENKEGVQEELAWWLHYTEKSSIPKVAIILGVAKKEEKK